ncbi:hypothetical protein AL057_01660 [Pseudomonas amygdali pv. myricae]|nr:hypothetical protein AL057_01660 [Pseudomonas amygdali pv. myricae]
MRSRVITPSLVVIMLACASAAPACFATDMTPGVQNESTSEADFQQWLATFRSNATTKDSPIKFPYARRPVLK